MAFCKADAFWSTSQTQCPTTAGLVLASLVCSRNIENWVGICKPTEISQGKSNPSVRKGQAKITGCRARNCLFPSVSQKPQNYLRSDSKLRCLFSGISSDSFNLKIARSHLMVYFLLCSPLTPPKSPRLFLLASFLSHWKTRKEISGRCICKQS